MSVERGFWGVFEPASTVLWVSLEVLWSIRFLGGEFCDVISGGGVLGLDFFGRTFGFGFLSLGLVLVLLRLRMGPIMPHPPRYGAENASQSYG